MKPSCSYLVFDQEAKKHYPCGKSVSWSMQRDDDDNLVRKYDHRCAHHEAVIVERGKKVCACKHLYSLHDYIGACEVAGCKCEEFVE